MHTNPLSGARYPDSTDNTNLSAYYQDLADDLSQVTVNQFASSTARDTAWTTFTSAGHTLTNGSKCTVAGAPQTYRGKWVGDLETQYRRIAATASGSLGPSASVDICASQSIPAAPFGVGVPYTIDTDAVYHVGTLNTGAGAKLEILFDGVTQDGNIYTNPSSAMQYTCRARGMLTVSDNSAHTIRAVLTSLVGTLTGDVTYGRLILAIRPYVVF